MKCYLRYGVDVDEVEVDLSSLPSVGDIWEIPTQASTLQPQIFSNTYQTFVVTSVKTVVNAVYVGEETVAILPGSIVGEVELQRCSNQLAVDYRRVS